MSVFLFLCIQALFENTVVLGKTLGCTKNIAFRGGWKSLFGNCKTTSFRMLKSYRGCRENAKCSNKSRLGAEKTPDAWKNPFGCPKIPQPNCKYRVPKNKRGCDLQFKLLSWRSFRLHVRKWKFLGVDIFGVGRKMRWTKKNRDCWNLGCIQLICKT